MIRFFIFFLIVPCYFSSRTTIDLVLKYKDSKPSDRQVIIESIVETSLHSNYRYDEHQNSRFSQVINEMAFHTGSTKLSQNKIIFKGLCDVVVKMGVKALTQSLEAVLTEAFRSCMIKLICITIVEADFLKACNRNFIFPESYIMAFLNVLHIFSKMGDLGADIPVNVGRHCKSEDCFGLFYTLMRNEYSKPGDQIILPVFGSSLKTKNSKSFDEFIQFCLLDPDNYKFPRLNIIKNIILGPISMETTEVLLNLINVEEFLQIFDDSEQLQNRFIHRLLVSDKIGDFFFDKLGSEFDLVESVQIMKLKMLVFRKRYDIIMAVIDADIFLMSNDQILALNRLLDTSENVLKSYMEMDMDFCIEVINTLINRIPHIFAECNFAGSELKFIYMAHVMTIISFIPIKLDETFSNISLDPLVLFINQQHQSKDVFSDYNQRIIRKIFLFSFTKIKSITLDMLQINLVVRPEHFIYASINSKLLDQEGAYQRFQLFHQFSQERGIDFNEIATSMLLKAVYSFDPFNARKFYNYCVEHRLVPKSLLLLSDRIIKMKSNPSWYGFKIGTK